MDKECFQLQQRQLGQFTVPSCDVTPDSALFYRRGICQPEDVDYYQSRLADLSRRVESREIVNEIFLCNIVLGNFTSVKSMLETDKNCQWIDLNALDANGFCVVLKKIFFKES